MTFARNLSSMESRGPLDAARLRELQIFSDCGDEELAEVTARSAVLRRDAGSVLVAEGDPGTSAFVLLEGTAAVTRQGEELRSLQPGDLFGELATFGEGVRTATVTASSDVQLLLIDPRSLADVIGRDTVAWNMLGMLSKRLRLSNELPGWSTVAENTASYTLGAEQTERNRLMVQAEVWAPMAEWLLDQIRVDPGGRAIDVACGPLGIMHLLADRVGADGEVFGLDREPRMIAMAREVAAERGLPLTLVEGDATGTDFPDGHFDLVHARTLMVNIVNPDEIVAEMRRITRPGGTVALQEPDCAYWVCDPPHPAWDRLHKAFTTTYRVQDRDFAIGRRLGRLLQQGGLKDVRTHAHVFRTAAGDVYQKLLLGVADAARPLIVEAGVYDSETIDRLFAALHAHLDNPDTTTAFAFWQAWGHAT
jgi:ubiquinone/menaquinone biosynthesis C-methylase UbiE/CRP-like cAMP-binding protein